MTYASTTTKRTLMPIRPAADGLSATAAIALPSSERLERTAPRPSSAIEATRMKTLLGQDAELKQTGVDT